MLNRMVCMAIAFGACSIVLAPPANAEGKSTPTPVHKYRTSIIMYNLSQSEIELYRQQYIYQLKVHNDNKHRSFKPQSTRSIGEIKVVPKSFRNTSDDHTIQHLRAANSDGTFDYFDLNIRASYDPDCQAPKCLPEHYGRHYNIEIIPINSSKEFIEKFGEDRYKKYTSNHPIGQPFKSNNGRSATTKDHYIAVTDNGGVVIGDATDKDKNIVIEIKGVNNTSLWQ